MRPRVRPPLWAEVLYFALAALLLAWVFRHLPPAAPRGAHDLPDVQFGFFGFIVAVFEAIWAGVQAFADISLAALAYTVQMLWAGISRLGSWALEIGRDTVAGFRQAWQFLRTLYDDVLKPAWQKFWKFVDWARHTLDHIFGPIIRWLKKVRGWLQAYYDTYVRPVLDTIDVLRKVLYVLEKLHIEWAAKLDAKLAALQDWIWSKFAEVMQRVNEVIDVVDRIMTVDGLIQKITFLRTIARDARYVGNAWINAFHRPLTADERKKYLAPLEPKSVDEHVAEMRAYFEDGSGPDAAYVDELAQDLAMRLRRVY